MTELDKFKRRIIRSVARLLFKEKKPEEELWAEMKKETGSDCRTLWERMRALCVKKLNRMIEADDRSSSLPKIARLSLTDWLLVDLVLVHEEIDVIAMDKANQKEYPVLIELFNLVQRFDVEARCGESLAEAWAAATVYYNRQGRQCSPMLLQRRWYQLKKLTRYRFYKFWFSYRGNTRLLEEARKTMPSRLSMAIAKRYPKVITAKYPDWEELIEKRFVIMPEEFEAKMRMPNLPKPCNSDAPDLVLVEPVIETIDLRVESDPEDNDDDMEDASDPEKSNDATDTAPVTEEIPVNETDIASITEEIPVNDETLPSNDITPSVQVKTEPMEEDGLSNVQLISARHVPEEISEKSPDITDVGPANQDREGIIDKNPDEITDVEPDYPEVEERQVDDSLDEDEDDIIAIPSVIPSGDLETSPSDNIAQTEKEVNNAEISPPKVPRNDALNDSDKPDISCDVDTINDSDEAVDDIIKIKADEYCRKTNEVPEKYSSIDDLIKNKTETYLKTPAENIPLTDKKPDSSTNDLKNKTEVAALDLMADLTFVDDGIEFVDDGVEFVEEDSSQMPDSTANISPSEKIEDVINQDESKLNEETNTFDLKLLMYPVVYTTKLDQMTIFKNKEIDSVRSIEDIEMANIESKPVSNKSFNIKIKEKSVTSIAEDPAHSDDIVIKQEVTVDDEEEVDDDDDGEEDELVPPNSYMLKKPKTRTYDPIKLCKNPDFNTKLKRLTIGFLSSTRNRQLLNACIPMTIDVSKAFESKLINGTIYLKPSDTVPIIIKQEEIEKQASSIIPTAMPAQSLIDNSKVDIQNLIVRPTASVDPMIPERTKTINLPDIDKVRRINQQLLTAQVPPLRVFAGNSRLSNEEPLQEVNSMPPTLPSNVSTETETTSIDNTLPKIKVENVKSSDTTVSETLTPAKEKLLKIINQAKISTKEALEQIDDGTTPKDFPMPIVVKKVKKDIPIELPKAYQKPCPFLPRKPARVSWAPKYAPVSKKNFDDFGLLTSDTLNKMLNLLTSGTQNCEFCTSKNKKSKCDHIQNRKDNKTSQTNNSEQSTQTGKEKDTVIVDDKEECNKPAEATVKKKQAKKATTKVVPISKVVRSNFCCWANQKLSNRKRLSRHLCPPNPCTCCCNDILVKKIQADEEKRRRRKELDRFIVELSDDEEQSLKKACESIETVVQQSAQLTERNDDLGQEKTTIPVITVSSTADDDVAPVAKVTISLDGVPTEVIDTQTPTTPPKPLIKIRAAPISSLMPVERPVINRPPTKAHIIIRPPTNPVTVSRMPLPAPTAPRLQMRSQLKPISPVKWTVCSCQKPALSQDTRRNIVIDGSKNCAIHPTPIAPKLSPQKIIPAQKPNTPVQNDKVLYLHSKSLAKTPSESPIFLGKNKILLTTVKFPRKNEATPVPAEVIPTPKVIPTLPLPNGVQLVLMPSGNVTYSVDPGVELDEAQLATLPTILAAVQEQLNTSGITSTAVNDPQVSATGDINPVTTNSQPEISTPAITNLPQNEEVTETVQTESNVSNEAMEPPLVNLQTSEVFEDTELPSKITDNVDLEVDAGSTKTNAPTEQNTCVTTNPNELEKEAESITDLTVDEDPKVQLASNETPLPVEELQNQTQPQETEIPSTNEETQSQTQTQESEIATEARKESDNTEGISSRKSLLSDLMEMSGISAEDATVPEPPAIEPLVTNEVPAANVIVNDETRNFPELSPVTSFAELKYACERNGKFFKLDIDSGIIVPINVCIKKNKTVEPKTKEFIDLTDDVESPDVENMDTAEPYEDLRADSSLLKTYVYNGKNVYVSDTVKPVKLFKAVRTAPPRVLRAGLKRSFGVLPEALGSSNISKKTHVEKRKQILSILNAKVEAKIDLVDSDEPMEEEYLIDSSDDESLGGSGMGGEQMLVEALEALESDDSSDDEPLAKKFKRLKDVNDKNENVKETNIYDEIPDVADPNELTNEEDRLGTDVVAPTNIASSEKALKEHQANHPAIKTTYGVVKERIVKIMKSTPPNEFRSETPVEENEFDEEDIDDEELDKRPEVTFLSDHSDDGDDDCILGV